MEAHSTAASSGNIAGEAKIYLSLLKIFEDIAIIFQGGGSHSREFGQCDVHQILHKLQISK